jgi:hypothetical protein
MNKYHNIFFLIIATNEDHHKERKLKETRKIPFFIDDHFP